VGVATGVSGDAQTGHTFDCDHCQTPFVHTAIVASHADGGQAIPGVSHAAPWFGTVVGHGGEGSGSPRQDQVSAPIGFPVGQMAHGGPGGNGGMQLHGTHEHNESVSDTHVSVVSVHAVRSGTGDGHPAGVLVQ
jgi:hypothetical protein